MYKFRWGSRRASVWVLLAVQLLLVLSYFYLKLDATIESDDDKVTFVQWNGAREQPELTYHTVRSKVFLRSTSTRQRFMNFNSSLCYVNGTDLVWMERPGDLKWECKCLAGWHGKDCGQPEVIWRAFLTYRRPPVRLKGPRTFERRIIYIFRANEFVENLVEMRVRELGDVVDLFVLYERQGSHHIERKLKNGFVKEFREKILYVKEDSIGKLWKHIRGIVRNLRNDDVILTSGLSEIPNRYALNFLKYYDRWPEPIRFRLRWSVFGFFWTHPARTIITGGASSVAYLKEVFNSKLESLNDNKTLSNPMYQGIILGDLNHSGGWYCEYCNDPSQIVKHLSLDATANSVGLEKVKKIDAGYVEELIGNGLYMDGKTELVRARRSSDRYFAPFHVLERDWKYDFLLTNFYSNLDYYEG